MSMRISSNHLDVAPVYLALGPGLSFLAGGDLPPDHPLHDALGLPWEAPGPRCLPGRALCPPRAPAIPRWALLCLALLSSACLRALKSTGALSSSTPPPISPPEAPDFPKCSPAVSPRCFQNRNSAPLGGSVPACPRPKRDLAVPSRPALLLGELASWWFW